MKSSKQSSSISSQNPNVNIGKTMKSRNLPSNLTMKPATTFTDMQNLMRRDINQKKLNEFKMPAIPSLPQSSIGNIATIQTASIPITPILITNDNRQSLINQQNQLPVLQKLEDSIDDIMRNIENVDQEIENLSDSTMYYNLANMFPEIRKEYIFALCKKYTNGLNKEMLMNNVIEHLFNNGYKYPHVAKAPELILIDLEDENNHPVTISQNVHPNFPQHNVNEVATPVSSNPRRSLPVTHNNNRHNVIQEQIQLLREQDVFQIPEDSIEDIMSNLKNVDQEIDNLPDSTIYYHLVDMFPEIQKIYIFALCKKYANEWEKEILINNLTVYLLNNGYKYPRIVNVPELIIIDSEDEYNKLVATFSDVNPNFSQHNTENVVMPISSSQVRPTPVVHDDNRHNLIQQQNRLSQQQEFLQPPEGSIEDIVKNLANLEQEIKSLLDSTVYYNLTIMFPEIKKEYIFALCKNYANKWEKNILMNNLVEYLLSNGHKYPRVTKAPELVLIDLEDKNNHPVTISLDVNEVAMPVSSDPRKPLPVAHNNNGQNVIQEQIEFLHEQDNFQTSEDSIEDIMNNLTNLDQEINNLPDSTVYYNLTSMFPEIKKEYIFALCKNYANKWEKKMLMNNLVERLLSNGDMYPRIMKASEPDPVEYNLEEQYNNLLAIFPDADPDFLRENAEKYYNEPNALKNFVQVNLEEKKYPTRHEYFKRLKLQEQIKQYTKNFNVKHFIEIFPDPCKYFEDPNRKSNCYLSINFLKHKYQRIKIESIKKSFLQCKNLTLTTMHLDNTETDMKKFRYREQPLLSDNIPFLQEVAFVKHKQEILRYIVETKAEEEKEFKSMKDNGNLLTCQCCYNDECVPSKCFSCSNGHTFCNICIVQGTEAKLADGLIHVKCFMDCEIEFPLSILQKFLKPTKFSILLHKIQEAEVIAAGIEGLVACPFCHFASIPPPEDKIFQCLNPECMKESCRACKQPNHVPLKCEEVLSQDKARLHLEEAMTEAFLRKCYNCNRQFYKEYGCNKMTCICGASMCYLCEQPVKHYEHFHAQGPFNKNQCPLYTDDRRINAEIVREAARQATQNMLKKNPNLQLDTSKLLPAVPDPLRTRRNMIFNVDQLPIQARRVHLRNKK